MSIDTPAGSAPGPAANPYAWVRHLLPRIVIGALIAAALVGVYAVIIGRFDETCWRLIGTIALFVFFSLISWYDADVSARRAAWFGAVSVVTSAYLLFVGLWKIWFPTESGFGAFGGIVSWILLVAVTRLGLLHIHLVLNTQRRFTGPLMSKVTVVTLILVGMLTAGLSLPLLFAEVDWSDAYWRLVAVVAILDALGTILIPLSYALFGPKPPRVDAPPAPSPVAPVPGWGAPSGPAPATPAPAPAAPAPAAAPATPAPASPHQPSAPTPPTSSDPASSPYPRLDAAAGLRLEWPRYINGQPLPARADGSPDFTGVVGY